jgi:hypothetical protein
MSILKCLMAFLLLVVYSFPVSAKDKSQMIVEIVDGFWLERMTNFSVETYEEVFVKMKQNGTLKVDNPAFIRTAAEVMARNMNSEVQKFKPAIRRGLINTFDAVYSEEDIIYYHSQIKNPNFQSILRKAGNYNSMIDKEVNGILRLVAQNIQKIVEDEVTRLKN